MCYTRNKMISYSEHRMATTVGDNLRRLRRRQNLTQAQLTDKAKVGPNVIARIETGQTQFPRVDTVIKLARALGVDPMDLIEDVED